jgi:hypothetical protein
MLGFEFCILNAQTGRETAGGTRQSAFFELAAFGQPGYN